MGKLLSSLIIEDSEEDTELLLRELRRLGYQVEFERVETDRAMRTMLSEKNWDLILSDYTLPKFGAPQALETLKTSGLDIPFIIVSGTIGEETAVAALKAGANDFIVKGKFARLGPVIERELREAESRRERKRAEEQIKYHARLLRHINDAVIATDDQFRITAWNRAAENIYGWTAPEVMGRSADEVLRAGLSKEQQVEAKELLAEKSSFRSERIHARKNGQPVYVEVNTIALADSHGKITGYVTVNRDITERRQAEEALRENERLLSESQRVGHVGSWSYHLITNSLQYSDEMYRLFDISPQEIPHTSEGFLNLVYQPDHAAAVQWIETIRRGRQPGELVFRIFRKNGELRYVQCRGAVTFDSSGKPVRFVGMAQDITERRLAEIQIRHQLEHLSALRKIDQAIASNFDLRLILNTLLSEVRTQLQVDAADILLLNTEEQVLEYAAGQGFRTFLIDTARVPIDKLYAGRAIRERRLIKIEQLKVPPEDPFFATLFAEENFVSYYGLPLIAKGRVEGVLEVFHRSPLYPYPEWLDFLNILAGQAALAVDNATLFENLQASNQKLIRAYDTTIEGWSRALDLRDKETEGHTQRVTEMTIHLARHFAFSEEELLHIQRGALLHDIGKMGVPDNILLKLEPLTEEEWIIMRQHPQYAYDLLKPITFLARALEIPYCHHEKWDGTGYPSGLKGEEIPLTARIFAVVDVWDALRSDRSYRLAWSKEDALAYIREQSGKHFDPSVVEIFLKQIE
ncbi:MAG TPA: HD domain-containing phosphohydrolase [Anaerolineales bacterium]|nr:HD domain-containing phosphohydrolase [Anaerolineales bacterium]